MIIPDPSRLESFARRLKESLPEGLAELQQDFDKNARAAVRSVLDRMDLVTREEFDVQRAVLLKTREKLEDLERKVADMEARQQS